MGKVRVRARMESRRFKHRESVLAARMENPKFEREEGVLAAARVARL